MKKMTKNCYAVTVKTVRVLGSNRTERNVTLWLDVEDHDVTLLGNLEHGTHIVVDQQLVDDLQALLNIEQEEHGQGQKTE